MSRLRHLLRRSGEPLIVALIRISGWSSIIFVFGIFFFIFREGAPFFTNKFRHESREATVESRPERPGQIVFNVPRREREREVRDLAVQAVASGVGGVASLWFTADPESPERVLVELVPGARAEEVSERLAAWVAARVRSSAAEDPDALVLEPLGERDTPGKGGDLLLKVPYYLPAATADRIARGAAEGKVDKVDRLWNEASPGGEDRVLVELAPGADPSLAAAQLESCVSFAALVLTEFPYESPVEVVQEKILHAIAEGKLRGVSHVGLSSAGHDVQVVLELEKLAEREAIVRGILAAIPLRQDHSHQSEFFSSVYWIPDSPTRPQFGILALILGSASVTFLALAIFVPFGLAAAIFVSEFCGGRLRETLKIVIELLAAIPSVVWGFIGYMVMNPIIIWATGNEVGINMLNGGIILALMAVPIIVSVGEDALKAVPDTYREAAVALGASRWQMVYRVLLPAAKNGLLAAVLLGIGRAIGETMAVLMATGHAVNVPTSILDPIRTLTATIAAELGETVDGSGHYRALFLIGTVLMVLAFTVNLTADLMVKGFRGKQNA
jgi:phosphate transport system permease protein